MCPVLLVTNTWNIVMGIFDMAQHVVNSSAGVVISGTNIDLTSVLPDLETRLQAMELGPLFGLWLQSIFVGVTMSALTHQHLYRHLRQNAGNLFADLSRPDPSCHDDEPGMERHGTELSQIPAGAGLSGVFHYGVCRYLRCAGSEYCHGYGTLLPPSGRAWATRCCCVSRFLRLEALPRVYLPRTSRYICCWYLTNDLRIIISARK